MTLKDFLLKKLSNAGRELEQRLHKKEDPNDFCRRVWHARAEALLEVKGWIEEHGNAPSTPPISSEITGIDLSSLDLSQPASGGILIAHILSLGWYCSYTSPNEMHSEHWVGAWRIVRKDDKKEMQHHRGYGTSMGEAAAKTLIALSGTT